MKQKPKAEPIIAPKSVGVAHQAFSLGGHRSLTILIVALMLFISGCVFFVNTAVLTTGTDEAYLKQATDTAQLIKFNTQLLEQAKEFSANANNAALPAGRIDPFTP